ncbi:MAG: gfo/Idh/MocA family oxidoreductase [Streptosporangiales bacterium]|nr:gfo/Idh/MocA family oxidoreductase [Streptosporangiales bacterium]
MRPIRAAIVGTGTIARLHAESLQALSDEVSVVAAVDVEGGRLAEFCSRHGISVRYPELPAMLECRRPELVHVCTPPNLHCEQALACLRAGASVVLEKPATMSLRELDLLAAEEGGGGPWVATISQHRFGSGVRRLRAAMEQGALGRPLLAVCHTMWFRDDAYFEIPWRGRWDTEGGGPTMGHGIHQMDVLLAVLGDWVEVSALAYQQARDTETEDLSVAHVRFANGAVATVANSVLSPRQESYLRFDFERATVELSHLYGYGDDDWRISPAPGFGEQVLDAWKSGEWGLRSGHRTQIALIARSLRAGTPPPVTSADARRTLQLIAGIYASAFGRRPVRRDELETDSPFYGRMKGDGPRW